MTRQGSMEIRANQESVAQVQRVRPRDPSVVAEEVRAYLKQVKAKGAAPAVDGSYCGNVGAQHRARGVR